MPWVPIEMPSDTVIVLKSTPLPPDTFTEFSTTSASLLICILHGVTFAPVDAMPTKDFEKSSEVNPTPRSIDLDAAWFGPSTRSFEYFLELIFFILSIGCVSYRSWE